MPTSPPIPWHFTAQPADLPIEQFRERYFHPDMPEKFEMIHGKLFWSEAERLHILGMLFESRRTADVQKFNAERSIPSADVPAQDISAADLITPIAQQGSVVH